jgi:hypothetical protein
LSVRLATSSSWRAASTIGCRLAVSNDSTLISAATTICSAVTVACAL